MLSRRHRRLAAALTVVLCAGGALLAQRSYRGVPYPPEMAVIQPEPDGDKPAEFYFARLAYRSAKARRAR